MTIKKLSDNIVAAARSYDTDTIASVIDDLRRCAPEIAEVAIRSAMNQDHTFSELIRDVFLDHIFPFPNKGFSISTSLQ